MVPPSPLAAPWWLLPPPPPCCVSLFSSLLLCAVFFFFCFFFLFARPRCLWLSLVSGPGCPGHWRLRAVCFGPPRRVLVHLTFSSGRSAFLLCSSSSGLGLPLSWSFDCPPLVAPLPIPPPLFFRAPLVSCFLWFPAPGALGLGALFFFSPPPRPLVFFLCAPFVSGFLRFPAPVVPGLGAVCFCFACLPLLGSPCPLAPLAAPWWLLPTPPPPPFRVSRFSSLTLGALFFCLPPLSLAFAGFPAPGALGRGAVACLFCWPPASLLSVRSPLVCCASPFAALWWLLPPPPPPPRPFVALFSSPPLGAPFFVFFFALSFRAPVLSFPPVAGFLWFPAPVFFFPASRLAVRSRLFCVCRPAPGCSLGGRLAGKYALEALSAGTQM